MAPQEGIYLLNCAVDPAKGGLLAGLRPAHLAHIIANQDRILYGGALGPADGPPVAICLAVRAGSLAAAEAMAREDPYAQAYAVVSVSPFQQRIPEEYPGQLAETLRRLTPARSEMTGKEMA